MTDRLPALTLSFDAGSGIARIVFNRPAVLNAINLQMADEFLDAVRSLSRRDGLRCLVLSGAGKAFMAGGDVASFAGGPEVAQRSINALLDRLHPAILALRALDAPVLAAVHGVAAGAGLSMALIADIVLAAENSRFLLAYDRIGAVPDCGGSWFLCHKAGAGRAAELMMLSAELSAAQAKDWGIVNATCEAAALEAETERLAKKLAAGPSRAHGRFRQLADRAAGGGLAAHLEAERDAFVAMTRTADFAEGVSAFLEKRASNFSGR